MASKVELINRALSSIGVESINSPTEQSTAAAVVAGLFDGVRDSVLASWHWRFAMKREALAQLADPELPARWSCAYAVPSDLVRVIGIEGHEVAPTVPYVDRSGAIHSDRLMDLYQPLHEIMGTTLYTSVDDAVLIFTCKVTNVASWSIEFNDAFVARLAAELVMPLKEDARMADFFMQRAERALSRAKAIDASQQSDQREREAGSILARY